MRKKLFMDMEMTGLGKEHDSISIGIVSDTGERFYAEFSDFEVNKCDNWVIDNVVKNLLWNNRKPFYNKSRYFNDNNFNYEIKGNTEAIMQALKSWISQFKEVEFISDVYAYDWVHFCDIFDGAFNIPENVYYIPFDLATMFRCNGLYSDISREEYADDKLKDIDASIGKSKHNSLWDAYVVKACYEKLEEL